MIGGYLLAARGNVMLGQLSAAVLGTALVIGSACVVNNYIDRGIDNRMKRTKWRAKLTDKISLRSALVYAAALSFIGSYLLIVNVNWLTAAVGAVGMIFYIGLYSIMKRRSVHGTLVGCVSGATPLVAGYTAASGQLDSAALLLFIIMVFWQLAHFYAIGLYRLNDYRTAGLPIMPVIRGTETTKRYIIINIIGFGISAALLTLLHYTGYIFLVFMLLVTTIWLLRGLGGYGTTNNVQWARSMFMFSLVVLATLSFMLSVGSILA